MKALLNKLRNQSEELSSEELQQLHALFNSEEGRQVVEEWLDARWMGTSNTALPELDQLIDRVEQRLRKQHRVHFRVWISTFQKYAALLIIPLLIGFVFMLAKSFTSEAPLTLTQQDVAEQEYISPVGMRSKVLLNDSTVVWLNADSRLIVPAGFNHKTRKVSLVGEAYFEVKRKADDMPFVVSTPEIDIKVLGTAFNVSAYPGSQTLETVLVEGEIEAVVKDATRKQQKEIRVEPAQLLTLQKKEGNMKVQDNVNTDLYTSWTSGKLVFRSTPMDEVARTLERWYNITITLHDEELKKHTYSGTFDNRSIEQIMRYIELSSPVCYKIDKEHVSVYAKN